MLAFIGQILFEQGHRVELVRILEVLVLDRVSRHSSSGNHGNVLRSSETLLTRVCYLYTPILWIV